MNGGPVERSIGRIAPSDLGAARRLLHIAVQAVGNAGRVFLSAAADYSHIAMEWERGLGGLAGKPIPSSAGSLKVILQFGIPTIVVMRESGMVLKRWVLEGLSLPQLETEMQRLFVGQGLNGEVFSTHSVNPMDMSVLQSGETFKFEEQEDALRELAAYYALTGQVLDELGRTLGKNSVPYVWPHHFDYSLLIPLKDGGEQGSRSITLGMSPGDQYYHQPYFYATLWPYPENVSLPEVAPPTRWHVQEWTGIVLTATDFLERYFSPESLKGYWNDSYGVLQNLLVPPPTPMQNALIQ